MWKCDGCGSCCKNGSVKKLLPEFWDEENQRCKMLDKNNRCSIYRDRPDICRVKNYSDVKALNLACSIIRKEVIRHEND